MDAWFESLENAHKAWAKAIANAGLEGNYRKLEMGYWNDVEALSTNDLNKF